MCSCAHAPCAARAPSAFLDAVVARLLHHLCSGESAGVSAALKALSGLMRLPLASRFHSAVVRGGLLRRLTADLAEELLPDGWTASTRKAGGALVSTWADRIWTPVEYREAARTLVQLRVITGGVDDVMSLREEGGEGAAGATPAVVQRNGVAVPLRANGGVVVSSTASEGFDHDDVATAAALRSAEERSKAHVAEHTSRGVDFSYERKREKKALQRAPESYMGAMEGPTQEYRAPMAVYGPAARESDKPRYWPGRTAPPAEQPSAAAPHAARASAPSSASSTPRADALTPSSPTSSVTQPDISTAQGALQAIQAAIWGDIAAECSIADVVVPSAGPSVERVNETPPFGCQITMHALPAALDRHREPDLREGGHTAEATSTPPPPAPPPPASSPQPSSVVSAPPGELHPSLSEAELRCDLFIARERCADLLQAVTPSSGGCSTQDSPPTSALSVAALAAPGCAVSREVAAEAASLVVELTGALRAHLSVAAPEGEVDGRAEEKALERIEQMERVELVGPVERQSAGEAAAAGAFAVAAALLPPPPPPPPPPAALGSAGALLLAAAAGGHSHAVKRLLRGATTETLSHRNRKGQTALQVAMHHGHAKVVEALRQAGATEDEATLAPLK